MSSIFVETSLCYATGTSDSQPANLLQECPEKQQMASDCRATTGLILGLRPANERRRYKVTASLIGWAQA